MHDLIDRKAAIDILDAYQVMLENGEENPYSWARFRMSELPSAQQDCTECAEYDHERHSCPKYCEVIRQTVEEVQPERKTGKWIPQNLNKSNGMISTAVYYYPKCSVCGASANYTNFCPNCGARMEGEG